MACPCNEQTNKHFSLVPPESEAEIDSCPVLLLKATSAGRPRMYQWRDRRGRPLLTHRGRVSREHMALRGWGARPAPRDEARTLTSQTMRVAGTQAWLWAAGLPSGRCPCPSSEHLQGLFAEPIHFLCESRCLLLLAISPFPSTECWVSVALHSRHIRRDIPAVRPWSAPVPPVLDFCS